MCLWRATKQIPDQQRGTMPTASILDTLTVNKTAGHFEDRFTKVHVFEIFGGPNNFAALAYVPPQPGP